LDDRTGRDHAYVDRSMIDTLKIAKQLESAHLSAEQAEAIATAIALVATDDLATKADLQGIEARMQSLETRLSDRIVGVRIDLIDRLESVTERINSVRDRVSWAVIGVGVLTWVLQLFGTHLKQFFGLP
jgi:hypothetical protein